MNELETYIRNKQKQKQLLLMTHVVIGYPSVAETVEIVKEMIAADVDLIELQIPFSDPLADGPVIMEANDQALANHVSLTTCFEVMTQLSTLSPVPLLFMGYYNSVMQLGVTKFCQQAKKAGAAGLIIPDIPFDEEEGEGFMAACDQYGLHHIRLLSPNSSLDRVNQNAVLANGFVYCTARVGTTGRRSSLTSDTTQLLQRVKKKTSVPVALGFGLQHPDQLKALVGQVEIAVVGSAMIREIQLHGVKGVKPYIYYLRGTIDQN